MIQRAQGVKSTASKIRIEDRSQMERTSLNGYLLQEREPVAYERMGTGGNYHSFVVAGKRKPIR